MEDRPAARPRIIHLQADNEQSRGVTHAPAHAWEPNPGVQAFDLVRADVGAQSLLTGVASIEPGASLTMHTHNVEESVTVVEGQATAEIDGKLYPLRPYETSYVPAGVPHRFLNLSDRPARILYVYPSIQVSRVPVE